MATLDFMKIDVERIIKDASPQPKDKKSHPFHLSSEKVSTFKANCDALNLSNALVLEAFMDQFDEYVKTLSPKKK